MAKERFLRTLRELVECYQAFERYSAEHLREMDLTPPQFDIIATLGNTAGMSFRELGEKTLITKGTLTGVVDRLEIKGLVRRAASANDARSTIVKLTERGVSEFERVFPAHVAELKPVFASLSTAELVDLESNFAALRQRFERLTNDRARKHRNR
jgi:MarR family transcriptional regulator, 2-MHQ and catechol-resistance regulon repressor